ncbi:hypothetical protein HB911_10820 [Listeria booriae]|nr:hypothetical protein [Listeria booriae]MBC2172097.1 hypothetical protein [Listeria booriae]
MESQFSYTSNFGSGKVHYYKNIKTGKISSYDAKVKISKPKDLRNGIGDDFWIVDLDSNFIPIGVRK